MDFQGWCHMLRCTPDCTVCYNSLDAWYLFQSWLMQPQPRPHSFWFRCWLYVVVVEAIVYQALFDPATGVQMIQDTLNGRSQYCMRWESCIQGLPSWERKQESPPKLCLSRWYSFSRLVGYASSLDGIQGLVLIYTVHAIVLVPCSTTYIRPYFTGWKREQFFIGELPALIVYVEPWTNPFWS